MADDKASTVRKAAILMVTLDTGTASAIMGQLDAETVEKLTLAIARLESIKAEE